MENNRVINVEQNITNTPNFDQHYQQHFQQHYASAAGQNMNQQQQQQQQHIGNASGQYQNQQPQPQQPPQIHIQAPQLPSNGMNNSFESRTQMIETDGNGNYRKIEEKREQSKKTTQTTTTTTSTSQPIILNTNELVAQPNTPVHFTNALDHSQIAYTHVQPVPVYAITNVAPMPLLTQPLPPPPIIQQQAYTTTTSGGGISVEHYPTSGNFSWTNADTYMHIFLTFYFGHFAAMLFFDGIIRNFVNLYLFEHRNMSMLIYILHIILSIALLAFCVWFLTICWRWWRNKSLLPMYGASYYDYNQRPLGPKERQATFHGCVFTAAWILIIGFFCFLVLGILDLSFKRELQSTYYSSIHGRYNRAAYIGDCVVFIFRLIFWVVGIVVTLLLSRDIIFKYCCPARRIKIDKERPTTVYEVRA